MKPRILYVIYTNPGMYPPLEHSSRILANAGWEVLFLGIGAMGTANKITFQNRESIQVQQLKFCARGWRQKLHFIGFGLWTLGWVLRWRPKWIYASDPFSSPVALLLSFIPGLRVIYHEHDSPATDSQKSEARSQRTDNEGQQQADLRPPTSGFQRFILWCRKQLARRATFCILPNEKRIELFKEHTGTQRPVLCVWNCPSRGEAEMVNSEFGIRNSEFGKVTLYYHGSINRDRLPPAILEAMVQFKGCVRLTVIGYETIGSKNYMADFLQRAGQLGMGEAVNFLGAVPRLEMMAQVSKCDVGLAFMPIHSAEVNMANMTGASNKAFEFLARRLALLVSDLPDWKKMFVEPGCGLACAPNNPQSIANALRWFVEHPEETRQMGERGREQTLKEWNYEHQFQPVLERMTLDTPADASV